MRRDPNCAAKTRIICALALIEAKMPRMQHMLGGAASGLSAPNHLPDQFRSTMPFNRTNLPPSSSDMVPVSIRLASASLPSHFANLVPPACNSFFAKRTSTSLAPPSPPTAPPPVALTTSCAPIRHDAARLEAVHGPEPSANRPVSDPIVSPSHAMTAVTRVN